MRLKETVDGICISTIKIPHPFLGISPPRLYETIITSDNEAIEVPGGERVMAYYATEFEARQGHNLVVARVRVHGLRGLGLIKILAKGQT